MRWFPYVTMCESEWVGMYPGACITQIHPNVYEYICVSILCVQNSIDTGWIRMVNPYTEDVALPYIIDEYDLDQWAIEEGRETSNRGSSITYV